MSRAADERTVVRSRFGAACRTCAHRLRPGEGWAVREDDGWTPYCEDHVPGGTAAAAGHTRGAG